MNITFYSKPVEYFLIFILPLVSSIVIVLFLIKGKYVKQKVESAVLVPMVNILIGLPIVILLGGWDYRISIGRRGIYSDGYVNVLVYYIVFVAVFALAIGIYKYIMNQRHSAAKLHQ